jgi:hypothetical protein
VNSKLRQLSEKQKQKKNAELMSERYNQVRGRKCRGKVKDKQERRTQEKVAGTG